MIFINGEGKAVYMITHTLALNMQVLNYLIIFTPTWISESKNLNGYFFHLVCSLNVTKKTECKRCWERLVLIPVTKNVKSDAGLGGGGARL